MTLSLIIFYLSAAFLAAVCVVTANNMSRNTCKCIKTCFFLVVIGLACLVCSVHYELENCYRLISLIPIMWGIAGWLLFDKYRAHEDLDAFRDFIFECFLYLRLWVCDKYLDFQYWRVSRRDNGRGGK